MNLAGHLLGHRAHHALDLLRHDCVGIAATFTKVYLSGGTAKIPALFKTIESRVGVPVEIMNPFKMIEIDSRRFDPAFIMDVAPLAAVAVGLGLRRAGDKLD